MTPTTMAPSIDPEFAESLLQTIDDPKKFGVHLLFNQFWKHAPEEVCEKYARQFAQKPALRAFVDEGHFAEPLTVERLAASPPGSLGEAAHRFITENGLEQNLATNYREFHEALESAGMLDGMPEPLRFAVLRGFQLHDLIHVVAGYGPAPLDELGLQAFCLAQLQFPYFAMWVSVMTTRMTFIEPNTIVPLMDAIAAGWQFGRTADDIQLVRWEDHLDEPLAALRVGRGIAPGGRMSIARI